MWSPYSPAGTPFSAPSTRSWGPVVSTALATAQAVQDVIDGNPDVLTAVIDSPATITDGLLNGFVAFEENEGLLTAGGPIGFGLTMRQDIATALEPGPLVTSAAAVNAPPEGGKLVPLAVNSGPAPAVEESDEDATNGNGTVLEEPDTSSPSQDKERKRPLSKVINSFKATPGGTSDSAGEGAARPKPIKAAVEGVTGTINSVRDGIRDSLGLSPAQDKTEATDDEADAAD